MRSKIICTRGIVYVFKVVRRQKIEYLNAVDDVPEDMPQFLLKVSSTFFKGVSNPKEFLKKQLKSRKN